MAIDQGSGDLLVIDGEANTVSRYHADGTPADFGALGTNVIDGAGTGDETPQGGLSFGGPGETEVAVDNSGGVADGNIYLPQPESGAVDIFASDGSYLGQLTESSEGVFSEPCGAAVDPSGNLYVGDFGGSIHKFSPAAEPPPDWANDANFAFAKVCAVAAGSGATSGSIFAAHFGGSASKLDSTTGEEKFGFGSESTTLAVDPASGHVFSAEGTELNEFDASGASGATEVSTSQLFSEVTGVAIDETSGNVYINHVGIPSVEVFGPLAPGIPLTIKKGPGVGEGTVETTSPRGISCAQSCPEASDLFSEGAIAELVATPAANSKFVGWTAIAGNTSTCAGAISPCFVIFSEATELQANFELIPVPAVTGLSPAEGSVAGGNRVEISGTGFAEATTVEIGDTVIAAPFIKNTDSLITVNAPKQAAGVVDVVVTTAGGSSPITAADQYTYVARPVVTAISPATGPTTGGDQIEITGSGLLDAAKVSFGDIILTAPFAENTDSLIKVNAPPHAAGTVDVRVTKLGRSSLKDPADRYTYTVPAKTPSAGQAGGGSGVVVSPPAPPEPPLLGMPRIAPTAAYGNGKAALQITCEGSGPCSGSLTLKAKLGGRSKVIGAASYDLAAGQSETIKVRIANGQAKQVLKEGKNLKATLSGDGPQGTVKLKPS